MINQTDGILIPVVRATEISTFYDQLRSSCKDPWVDNEKRKKECTRVFMTKIQRGCFHDKTGYDSDSSNSNSSYNKYSSLLYNLSIALEIY